jgi:hypothetical protein
MNRPDIEGALASKITFAAEETYLTADGEEWVDFYYEDDDTCPPLIAKERAALVGKMLTDLPAICRWALEVEGELKAAMKLLREDYGGLKALQAAVEAVEGKISLASKQHESRGHFGVANWLRKQADALAAARKGEG